MKCACNFSPILGCCTDSGVHGGLLVLDPSFNGDSFATALGISQSKNIVRRHLATELESLVQVEK